MKRQVSRPTVLVAATAAVILAVTAYLVATWPPGARPRETAAGHAPVAPATPSPASRPAKHRTVLGVVGDSYSLLPAGTAGPTWPRILGKDLHWQVVPDASDGSGYLEPGRSGPLGVRINAVLADSPDVVVLAGGAADLRRYSSAQIMAAADRVVSRVVEGAPDAEIVLVSPFSNGEPHQRTLQLAAGLQQIAKSTGVAYVDATRWLEEGHRLFASDGVHPSPRGQRMLARRMERALVRLGVAQPAGQSTS